MLLDKFLNLTGWQIALFIFLNYIGLTLLFMYLGVSFWIATLIALLSTPWILYPIAITVMFTVICVLLITDMFIWLIRLINSNIISYKQS
ncbi:MAG: hypothetical protein CSA42_05220 [Gammaproteobacteria bacterium]|nr:MAG: hypothetical protein CSA42_05220 [Gammaproteobacteria bacterium]